MKKILFTLVLLILATAAVNAQKIYEASYESRANVKVYVVNDESQCDLKVYMVKNESDAVKDGLWYKVAFKNEADLNVYFVNFELQAEIKIFYVDNESLAGWRNIFKSHILSYKRSLCL